MSYEGLREHLHRLWAEELYKEYDNISFQFRVKLRPAVIRIDVLTSVWGSWHPLTRTITIAQALIEKHSWDVVIEVLKHEMAHQLASEVYGGTHHHDEIFARACQRLGVADWAAKASGALPESIPHWKDRALSTEDERLMKRAEKLLALAGSSNEHEALIAMQKVQELYAKHRLERLRSNAPAEDALVHLIISRQRKRMEAFESMIFSILGEHFFVRVIFGRQYDAAALEHFQVAELLGTRENVQMAEYVYHFLWNQIHALWRDYQKRHGKPTAYKKSYLMGVLSGFRDKLARGAKPAAAEGLDAAACKALVARADRELDEFVARRHPRLTSKSWGGGYSDRSSFNAGVAAGEQLTLRKGISRHDGNRGLLLK